MPHADVEGIIGQPRLGTPQQRFEVRCGLCSPIGTPLPECDVVDGELTEVDTVERWYGDAGCISLGFDSDGNVVWKHFQRFREAHVLDRLREFLGW